MHFYFISIPAPARGATQLIGICTARTNFNSRPRTGGDAVKGFSAILPDISIPAPARGATQQNQQGWKYLGYFNSRPRTGGDSKNVQIGLVNFIHLCCILFSQNGKRAVHF